MLLLAGFIPDTASISTIAQPDMGGVNADAPGTRYKRGRVALTARAAERRDITKDVLDAVLAAARR